MIIRYWGPAKRSFTWMWADPKGWTARIGHATPTEYAYDGHITRWTAPAYALTECEPEIRAAYLRIKAGEDLTDTATHVLAGHRSPHATLGTWTEKTP